MPSTITHAYFALDVLNKLDEQAKKNLANYKEQLKLFSQGPDFFYFYNIANLKKGKNIRLFSDFVHKNKTQDFFITLVNYIKNNNFQKNYEIISFLYGFINHYVLDSTVHPFIIYKTGIYNHKIANTFKYKDLHEDIESYIDAYFIHQNEQRLAKRFKPHKFCFNNINFSKELNQLIDNVFAEVFQQKNISPIYHNCIKQAKTFNYIYRYDKWGVKKSLYKLIDFFTHRYFKKKEFLSYHQNIEIKKHYLNLEKREWKNPLNENEISNLSFIELYIISINKAVNIINKVNKVLYNGEDIAVLNDIFDNSSYISGKNCHLGHNFSSFEF